MLRRLKVKLNLNLKVSLALLVPLLFIAPVHRADLSAFWATQPSPASDYLQNNLKVHTTNDWISTQLLVQLGGGEIHYAFPGVLPSLNPTLLVGAAANTSLSFPSAGNPIDPLNDQIPGFGGLPNAGTGGPGGLGGSLTPLVDLTTFDLTYFGPPSERDDIAPISSDPLDLAQMTLSEDSWGTWAVRIRNATAGVPADTLVTGGWILRGEFLPDATPGDMNADGVVSNDDISLFVQALTDLPSYEAANPNLPASLLGDFNGDGVLSNSDIAGFVAAVSNKNNETQVPEPGALPILALLSLLIFRARLRHNPKARGLASPSSIQS